MDPNQETPQPNPPQPTQTTGLDAPAFQQVPEAATTPPPPPPPTPPQAPKPKSPILMVAVIMLLLSALVAAGYFAYQNYFLKQPSPTPAPSSPTPSPSADPTTNWKILESDKYKISYKYPSDWTTYTNATSKEIGIPEEIRGFPESNIAVTNSNGCTFYLSEGDIGSEGPTNILTNTKMTIDKIPFTNRSWYRNGEQIPFFSYYFPDNFSNIPTVRSMYSWNTPTPTQECQDTIDQILSTFKFTSIESPTPSPSVSPTPTTVPSPSPVTY